MQRKALGRAPLARRGWVSHLAEQLLLSWNTPAGGAPCLGTAPRPTPRGVLAPASGPKRGRESDADEGSLLRSGSGAGLPWTRLVHCMAPETASRASSCAAAPCAAL